MRAESYNSDHTAPEINEQSIGQLCDAANKMHAELTHKQYHDTAFEKRYADFLKESTDYFNLAHADPDNIEISRLQENLSTLYEEVASQYKHILELSDQSNNIDHLHLDTDRDTPTITAPDTFSANKPQYEKAIEVTTEYTETRSVHELLSLYETATEDDWQILTAYPSSDGEMKLKSADTLRHEIIALFDSIPYVDLDMYVGTDTQFSTLLRLVREADVLKNPNKVARARKLFVTQIAGLLQHAKAHAGEFTPTSAAAQELEWEDTVAAAGMYARENIEIAKDTQTPEQQREPVSLTVRPEVILSAEGSSEELTAQLQQKFSLFDTLVGNNLSKIGSHERLLLKINRVRTSVASYLDSTHKNKETIQQYIRIIDVYTRQILEAVENQSVDSETIIPTQEEPAATATTTIDANPSIGTQPSEPPQSSELGERFRNRLEYRNNYKNSEAAYLNGYKTYCAEQGTVRKGVNWTKSLFGIAPTLPEPLQHLKEKANSARTQYAEVIQAALTERQERTGAATTQDSVGKMSIAFSKRFIIGRIKNQSRVQQEALNERTRSAVGNILQTLIPPPPGPNASAAEIAAYTKKATLRKNLSRSALVIFAGATGGIGAATHAAQRILIGSTVGAAVGSFAAKLAYSSRTGAVQEATTRNARAQHNAVYGYRVDLMNVLEERLEQSGFDLTIEERRQKAATIAAAGLAGFAAGRSVSEIVDTVLAEDIEAPSSSDLIPPAAIEIDATPATEELPATPEVTQNTSSETTIPTHETVIVTVEKGDTLWALASDTFKQELSGLSPAQQNLVLEKTLDRIQADEWVRHNIHPDLNDVDLIRTGQQLDVGAMKDTLDQVIHEVTHESQISTGAIPVTAIDGSEPEMIPIQSQVPITTIPETTINFANGSIGYFSSGPIILEMNYVSQIPTSLEHSVHDALAEILPHIASQNPTLDTNSLATEALTELNNRFKEYEWWQNANITKLTLPDATLSLATPEVLAPEISLSLSENVDASGSIDLEVDTSDVTPEYNPPPNSANIDDMNESILEYYGDNKIFEREVYQTAQNLEDAERGILTFLGRTYKNPLDVLSDVTLEQLTEIQELNPQERRAVIENSGLRYETYLAFQKIISDEAATLTDINPEKITASQLFKHHILQNKFHTLTNPT